MRNDLLKVGLFFCALIFVISQPVGALSVEHLALNDSPFDYKTGTFISEANEKDSEDKKSTEEKELKATIKTETPTAEPVKKPEVKHVVVAGETLTAIAEKYSITWNRIFDKNINITQPDILAINSQLIIPEAEEELKARPVPQPVIEEPVNTPSESTYVASSGPSAKRIPRSAASPGNTYAAGYCTWYAKSRRPDLPNRMGNAISWVASARAQGYATGSTPSPGAIGQQGNHVVYVESVNPDGTVTVSEMNYQGLFVISGRTVAANNFQYIY